MRPSFFFIHSRVPRDTLVTKTQSKRVCTLLHIFYHALLCPTVDYKSLRRQCCAAVPLLHYSAAVFLSAAITAICQHIKINLLILFVKKMCNWHNAFTEHQIRYGSMVETPRVWFSAARKLTISSYSKLTSFNKITTLHMYFNRKTPFIHFTKY